MKKELSGTLNHLVDEAVYIIRETVVCRNPAILFSGGKDSAVVAWLARLAFAPAKVPYPLLHIDTGHNYSEVLQFRDEFARQFGFSLRVYEVEASIARGTVHLPSENASRNTAQSVTLLEAIEAEEFGALIGGARRDEEKARSKERIFSYRNAFGVWEPKQQRPELWDLYNTHCLSGDHLRVFPISNWTEIDIWEFVAAQDIPLPTLYYAHPREVAGRNGLLIPRTPLTEIRPHETTAIRSVRFRTVGDMSCTCPVESNATDAWQVLAETRVAEIGEREATRLDDKSSKYAMEQRKKVGYF